jgi:O-antigen ligase
VYKTSLIGYAILLPMLIISFVSNDIGGGNKVFIFVILLSISTQIKKINLKMLKIIVPVILIFFIGTFSLWRSGLFNASAYIHDLMIPLFLLILGLIFYKQKSLSIHFERLFFNFLEWSLYIHLTYIVILFLLDVPLFYVDFGQLRFLGSMGSSATSIFYLALFIPFFIRYLFYKEKKYLFLSAFLIAMIILCGTRITLLALMSIIFFNTIGVKVFSLDLKKMMLILVLFVIFYLYVFDDMVGRMFFGGNVSFESLNTSGRTVVWEGVINKFLESTLFGFGSGATTEYLLITDPLGNGRINQVHNDYIKIIFDFGLIGLTLFLFITKNMFNLLSNKVKHSQRTRMNITISKSYIYAFMILMITDNVWVYIFYIYPFLIYYFYTVEQIRIESVEHSLSNIKPKLEIV